MQTGPMKSARFNGGQAKKALALNPAQFAGKLTRFERSSLEHLSPRQLAALLSEIDNYHSSFLARCQAASVNGFDIQISEIESAWRSLTTREDVIRALCARTSHAKSEDLIVIIRALDNTAWSVFEEARNLLEGDSPAAREERSTPKRRSRLHRTCNV